jgi:malate dehydrogenase
MVYRQLNPENWMQMNPAVTELALYDVVNVPGVAADVSHINTRAIVKVGIP